MRHSRFIAILIVGLHGCGFDTSGVDWNTNGDGPDAATTTADGPVEVDAATPCVAAACPLGCNTPSDRCNRLAPTNFDVSGFYDGLHSAMAISDGEELLVNTDTGLISGHSVGRAAGNPGAVADDIYFDLVAQSDGTLLAVFAMTSLDLPAGATLVVSGSHPAAFFATGSITIAGKVEAHGSLQTPGPGGGWGATESGSAGASCNGGQGGGGAQNDSSDLLLLDAGGGGGGLVAKGGNGAAGAHSISGDIEAAPGVGGIVSSDASPLSPLRGGCGGGAGGGPDDDCSVANDDNSGGGGGGGIQFSAQDTLTVAPTGVIDVGGGQGRGGQCGSGGGGGGSGGSILLEAPTISVQGTLVANGGGGGAGAPTTTTDGADGQPAQLGSSPAPGGPGSNWGGSGGEGGAGAVYAGGDGTVDANGGGGGGSVGAIGIRYQTSITTTGTLSPDNHSTQSGVAVW